MESVQINKLREKEGSILIVAVMFATIAAVSIGSFIRIAGTEMRMANSNLYGVASLNLAEAGVEEALYAINRADNGAWATQGWTSSFSGNRRENVFNGYELGSGATGEVHVVVNNANSDDPTVVAEGRVMYRGDLTATRQLEIRLRKRTFFASGMTSREEIVFSGGQVSVASYLSSDPDAGIRDNGSVASNSVKEDSITIGNADIWGYVATRGTDPVIRNGTVRGEDTPDGVSVDPDRISMDFSSSFPTVSNPDGLTAVPYTGELLLGDPLFDTPIAYQADDISFSGQEELVVRGDVILIVHNDFRLTGGAKITVSEGASLQMYVGGDVHIRGNGMVNATGLPENLQVYGTSTDHEQDFSMGGGPSWHAAVYAPNAILSMNGGGNSGEFRGSVVGKRITMNGNSTFLYDEDLAGVAAPDGNFGMARWHELRGNARHTL